MALTATKFRDALRERMPPWLQRGNAEKILWAIGVQLDGLGDALLAGVRSRFPGLYSGQSLPHIGRDRRIRRGRIESEATYANRLTRWLDDHRRRGGPYAMLAQLHAHYAPDNFPIELIYRNGYRLSMDAAGIVVDDVITTHPDITWPPDDNPEKFARWWLVYYWPLDVIGDGVWGDPGTWGDGGVWGSSLSSADVADLRLLPREWNNAMSFGRLVLVHGAESIELGIG